ncbi:MAG: hypothetical protein ABEH59_03155 [Halobacteriales archaeon]
MRYNAGGRPGAGRYTCTTCGWTAELTDPEEPLPACPECPSGENATYRPGYES